MAAIEVSGLSKRFGPVLAVDDLSFRVEPGTVVGFLGPNGAGKTTTLRMLLGLVRPDSGNATINGRRYVDLEQPLRSVGASLEASACHPGRTARSHLRIQALAADIPRIRIDEVLALVDLAGAADRRVGGFSLGMRQRLALATALIAEPEVLILDEPANGLDPEGVRWLRDLLRGLAQDGRTVLVSSHILAEVAQTVDSVVILDHGRLVADATLDEFRLRSGRAGVRVRTPQPEALRALLADDGAEATILDPKRVRIVGAGPERVGTLAAANGIPIFETNIDAESLEDAFFQATAPAEGEARR
jgi:ABC-2 type transport system ATP-binding protein